MSTETPTLPTLSESYAVKAARFSYIIEQPNTLDILVQRVAEGETVKEIARAWDIPHGRLSAWLLADKTRCEQYFRAQQVHAHQLVEETVEIADSAGTEKSDVMKAKLRIETRFQVAAHHAKERYGETAKGSGGTRVNVVVQRSPQQAVDVTARQGDEHGDHRCAVTDSPR